MDLKVREKAAEAMARATVTGASIVGKVVGWRDERLSDEHYLAFGG